MNSSCCTTLSFDQITGDRVFPKKEEDTLLPSTWSAFLSWYQQEKGINACPLYDFIEGENAYLLIVCAGENLIICHRLPANRLNAMFNASLASSMNDPLTGALRKEHTKKEIENVLNEFVRNLTPFCMMFIDLDHFKRVNDIYGHISGDQVLSEISKTIKTSLREHDSFIRYGGEEFVAILQQTSLPMSLKVAEQIRKTVETTPIHTNGKILNLTVSIGITTPETSDTIFSIIDRADRAVYKAKRNGRNKIEYL